MIRISHEIPKQLFPYQDLISDFPYALGHLLLKHREHYNEEYAFFYKSVLPRDFSILDNSAFELKEPILPQELFDLGEEYLPSHLIIPDFLHDFDKTIASCENYINSFPNSTPKLIAVLQGSSFEEVIECYRFYNRLEEIDLVALPFDFMPGDITLMDRVNFMERLVNEVPVLNKKIHLLGCLNPRELTLFTDSRHRAIINSVDTSAPIVCGWKNIKFHDLGYDGVKPKDKLAENLDVVLDNNQLKTIFHNVRKFRSYIHK